MSVDNVQIDPIVHELFNQFRRGRIGRRHIAILLDKPEAVLRLGEKQAPPGENLRKSVAVLDAQSFWQNVWDELLGQGKVTVPPVPRLSDRQVKSMGRFGFLLMYLPTIAEDQYPECFVKLDWGRCLDASCVQRKPLTGQWVAVETIRKPDWDDSAGYPDDRLMAALKRNTRFNTSHDDLIAGGILLDVAKVTGFPRKGTRLPSAEEWNLVGNLFNWLGERCSMSHLPNLGSTQPMEWCGNAYGFEGHLDIGGVGGGGLAFVSRDLNNHQDGNTAFRVLAVL